MDHLTGTDISSLYVQLLKECINTKSLVKGRLIHSHMIRTGFVAVTSLSNRLINMYSKCLSIEDARQVFDKMTVRDIFTWNNLITGYVKNERMNDARKVFDEMPERDGVSWNAIIAGYAQYGNEAKSLQLFCEMRRDSQKPTQFTFGSVLRACASLQVLQQGMQIHAHSIEFGFEYHVFTASSLVDMYSKCKRVHDARKVFDEMPERNVVSWNAMIAGYSQNGNGEDTLRFFKLMRNEGMKPDHSTLACVISACACLTALEHGKQVQGYVLKIGLEENLFVGSALVDIYAKCGSIDDAYQMFDKMPVRNTVSWNSMIVGYAQNGRGKEAIQLFEDMLRKGPKPDQVTFLGVLNACSHCGLIEEGRYYFNSMLKDHYVVPDAGHYSCMVDLFGRSGHLDEAEVFINNMPFEPDAVMWGALLGACRMHGNVRLGERAAKRLFELEPENTGSYILMAHMYEEIGSWDNAAKVRKMMRERGLKKETGCSWTEVKNRIHTFVADDMSHPQAIEILGVLKRLTGQMETVGYVPPAKNVLVDLENGHKETKHIYHSEKLAIAFALISTSPEATIRIVKNLRVCGDCHTVTKFISQIVGREIILRDVSRYHHFKKGLCSCGDYW